MEEKIDKNNIENAVFLSTEQLRGAIINCKY